MISRRDVIAAGTLAAGAAVLAAPALGATLNKNRRIVLAKRPRGEPTLADFRLEELPVPELKDGEILLKTKYLSLDPGARGVMNEGASRLDEVMVGATVSRVVESRNAKFKEGELVSASSGWQEYQVSNGAGVTQLDPRIPKPSYALGVLGIPGLTAYGGLLEIGQPKAGETLVVAAATGADRSSQLIGQFLILRQIKVQGFIVSTFFNQQAAFIADVSKWLQEGRIKYREDITQGLENAPQAFLGLFTGANFGKLLVEMSD